MVARKQWLVQGASEQWSWSVRAVVGARAVVSGRWAVIGFQWEVVGAGEQLSLRDAECGSSIGSSSNGMEFPGGLFFDLLRLLYGVAI